MKKRRIKNQEPLGLFTTILSIVLFGAVFWIVLSGLYNTSNSVSDRGVSIAEQAVRRGMISCYAVEGSYPASYEYLREHYGVAVNEDKYIVHYTVFASNIMPEVSVEEKDGAE